MPIAPHTHTLPHLPLSLSTMQFWVCLSPLLLHTLILPSTLCIQNLDSSDQMTRRHWSLVHLTCSLAQAHLAARWRSCSSRRTAGWRALNPAVCRRFRTVWADIRRRPGTVAAVRVAGLKRSLKKENSIHKNLILKNKLAFFFPHMFHMQTN